MLAGTSANEFSIGISPRGGLFIVQSGMQVVFRGGEREGVLLIPGWMLRSAMGAALPEPDVILRILEASPLGRMLRNNAMVIAAGNRGMPLDSSHVMLQSMVELIQIILKHALPAEAETSAARDGLTERAYQFIERNLGDSKLSAQAIAEGIGCSRATLYRLFSQRNTSVARVVREARLKRVCQLLAGTPADVPLKRIALEVGFVDFPNFTRFVRHHFGMSPSVLRHASAL